MDQYEPAYADAHQRRAAEVSAGVDGRRRAEWIAANGPCALCGSEEGLTIDHINPDLKAATLKGKNRNGTHRGTGGIWSWPKARRDPELAKNRVLCGRCHRIKLGW